MVQNMAYLGNVLCTFDNSVYSAIGGDRVL